MDDVRFNASISRSVPRTPGTLEVVCGCMFAGKTEALLDQVNTHSPDRVLVFKHVIDDRYHPLRVVSHRGRSCPATPIERAEQMIERVGERVEFVAVDEGHFFDDGLVDVCTTLTRRGLHVLVTTLDNDSWGRPFPLINALRAAADVVKVKTAACARCGRTATRTQRLTPILDGRMVGGPECAEPRCVQCWTPPPAWPDQMTRAASKTGPSVQHNA